MVWQHSIHMTIPNCGTTKCYRKYNVTVTSVATMSETSLYIHNLFKMVQKKQMSSLFETLIRNNEFPSRPQSYQFGPSSHIYSLFTDHNTRDCSYCAPNYSSNHPCNRLIQIEQSISVMRRIPEGELIGLLGHLVKHMSR